MYDPAAIETAAVPPPHDEEPKAITSYADEVLSNAEPFVPVEATPAGAWRDGTGFERAPAVRTGDETFDRPNSKSAR